MSKIDIASIIFVMGLAMALRLFRIGEVDVWIDEGFCLRMAEFSFVEIWERTAQDTHPPLYYWLLKCWQFSFGDAVSAARTLSALLGTGTVAFVWLFVRKIDDDRNRQRFDAATFAALLVALSPMHIHWSSQVRMYVLTTFLAAAMSWQLVRTLRRTDQTVRSWILISALATALVYTHVYGIFSVSALYLYAICSSLFSGKAEVTSSRMNQVWPVLVSSFFVYQLCSPWIIVLLEQQSRVRASFWIPPLTWELLGESLFDQFHPQYSVSDAFLPVFRVSTAATIGQWILQAAVLILVFLVASHRRFDGYLIAGLAVPIVISIGLSISIRNIILGRYLIIAGMFLLIVLAVSVSRIKISSIRWSVQLFALSAIGFLCVRQLEARSFAASMPALQNAVREYERLRNSNEPLVVADPVLFLSTRPSVSQFDTIHTFGSRTRFPYYIGTAAMTDSDFLNGEALDSSQEEWVWTLASQKWNRSRDVSIGTNWQLEAERVFDKGHEKLTLRLFRRTLKEIQEIP